MFEKRLTRFEKARIVAARYMLLMRGAPPLVDVSGKKDLKEVALEELVTRRLPLTIIRFVQGSGGEYKKLLVPLSEIEKISEEDEGELRCLTD